MTKRKDFEHPNKWVDPDDPPKPPKPKKRKYRYRGKKKRVIYDKEHPWRY